MYVATYGVIPALSSMSCGLTLIYSYLRMEICASLAILPDQCLICLHDQSPTASSTSAKLWKCSKGLNISSHV